MNWFLLIAFVFVWGCGDDGGNANSFNNVVDVSFPDMGQNDMGMEDDMGVPDLPGAGLFVEPPYSVLRIGQQRQLTAIGVAIDGTVDTSPEVVWTADAPSVVTIDENALMTATGPGETQVTGIWQEFLGVTEVKVVGSTTQIAAGAAHTCALTNDGSVMCWGDNSAGQLGLDMNTEFSTAPVVMPSDEQFIRVTAGNQHTCALNLDGEAFCWGDNKSGQLGDGTTGSTYQPVAVAGQIFVDIMAGGEFTCALDPDLKAWCWGNNEKGQLGSGVDSVMETTPVEVAGGIDWASLSPGNEHVCGMDGQAKLQCWGDNSMAQLGEITMANSLNAPQMWMGLRIGGVRSGTNYACGIGLTTMCWGTSLGLGSNVGTSATPVEVQTTESFQGVFPGGDHTCAFNGRTQVSCWGDNSVGQLGDGATTSRDEAAPVLGMAPLTGLTAGTGHTCGISSMGDAFCWGLNDRGQLGDGTIVNRRQPTYASPVP